MKEPPEGLYAELRGSAWVKHDAPYHDVLHVILDSVSHAIPRQIRRPPIGEVIRRTVEETCTLRLAAVLANKYADAAARRRKLVDDWFTQPPAALPIEYLGAVAEAFCRRYDLGPHSHLSGLRVLMETRRSGHLLPGRLPFVVVFGFQAQVFRAQIWRREDCPFAVPGDESFWVCEF